MSLNVISLYTGAGGLDYGFEAAGFRIRAAIDIDSDSCETIRRNRSWYVINEPIQSVPGSVILQATQLQRSEIAAVIGGPPCQPFSKSSYWVDGDSRRLDDPRSDTVYAFMRFVEEVLPTSFLLENVHGINYSGKDEGLLLIQRLTRKINSEKHVNYTLSWKVLNAVDYGVPQIRERFFLVAHREGKLFRFPQPTCSYALSDPALFLEGPSLLTSPPYVTCWDAIGELTMSPEEDLRIKGKWGKLLESIPEGENYLWHTNRKAGEPLFGWRTRFWSFLLKLAKNRPSWTIQAQPGPNIGPFHWDNRRLSISEMAALQTFPRGLCFAGGRGSVQRQIGNAVPSLLSEILAREIAAQFFAARFPTGPKLSVGFKRPIPPPATIGEVPKEFLSLRGNHAPHPGEGKGSRAIRVRRRFSRRNAELSLGLGLFNLRGPRLTNDS